jgi:hypothetical protein
MVNYIKTNSIILLNTIQNIKNLSKIYKTDSNIKCNICSKIGKKKYIYNNIIFYDTDIHLFKKHNLIDINLYEKICNINDKLYNFMKFSTDAINIIDGLYEHGSKKEYIENNKNLFISKKNKFSEHYGFIIFSNRKVEKIIVLNDHRVDKTDPLIYQPKNNLEALTVDYIFHTHPTTPYIGSRIKNRIIYEFPSISDIIHFIEHHNEGKLIGSIILTPEGIYNIHKYLFDREKIKVDYDLLIDDLENIYIECYNNSYNKYRDYIYENFKYDKHIKIPDDYFFENIAIDFQYINKINNVLIRYDLYVDYYPRIKLPKTDYWILPDIFLPII